jgi:hypothetical protein
MDKATMKGLLERARETNAQYEAATPAERRVMVAQDVIAALTAKQIVAESGVYLTVQDEYASDVIDSFGLQEAASFQNTIADLPPCNVCAKGAIFVCAVARQNRVTNEQAFRPFSKWTGTDMEPLLAGLFSAEQLALIEREFEGRAQDEELVDDELAMGLFSLDDNDDPEPLYSDEARMIKIMENIIANGGTFCPEAG